MAALSEHTLDLIVKSALSEVKASSYVLDKNIIKARLSHLELDKDNEEKAVNRIRTAFIKALRDRSLAEGTRRRIYDSLIEMAKHWPLNDQCGIHHLDLSGINSHDVQSTGDPDQVDAVKPENHIHFYSGHRFYNDKKGSSANYLAQNGWFGFPPVSQLAQKKATNEMLELSAEIDRAKRKMKAVLKVAAGVTIAAALYITALFILYASIMACPPIILIIIPLIGVANFLPIGIRLFKDAYFWYKHAKETQKTLDDLSNGEMVDGTAEIQQPVNSVNGGLEPGTVDDRSNGEKQAPAHPETVQYGTFFLRIEHDESSVENSHGLYPGSS